MRQAGVVGGGTMAHAIVAGAIDAGIRQPDEFLVADPSGPRRELFEAMGVPSVGSAAAFAGRLGDGAALVLAVKPQMLEAAAADLAGVPMDRLVVSILAGSTSGRIRALLGERARVVRVMPNTPAQIRRGATALAVGEGATRQDLEGPLELFGAIGRTFVLEEALIDAFTAVAGSGPAYLFYLAEAMERAAVELGLPAGEVGGLVAQTLIGAAALLDGSDLGAEELRRRVTSPGGTTAAAVESLDGSGVSEAVVRAISAARDRGRELGSGA